MIDRRNKKYSDKDKIRKKSSYYSDKRSQKKHLNEIKVVSTNITKNKKIEEKKGKKFNFISSKKENNLKTNKIKKEEKPKKTTKLNKSIADNKVNIKKEIMQYKLNILEKKICAKCNRIIEEMESSIKEAKKDKYYHFNCVINEIKKDNLIGSKQRIVYLGSGAFGVIEDLVSDNNSHKFIIKKKIQYIDNS